ncbi:hypothetical protein XENOCAPTIV_018966, partial [Xenoophorus captivus]
YSSCRGSEFTCSSGRCIPQNWVCDRFNDCGDFSDERGCDSDSRDCYPGEWGCPGSTACIPVGKTTMTVISGGSVTSSVRIVLGHTTVAVYSASYNGENIKEILTAAVPNVQNLAVDWINFKLYVLDATLERIDMCDFDGGNRVTLYMFFTDMGANQEKTKLERAFMDGSNRVELVKSRLGTPTAITLDIITKRVYWSDSHFDTVETVTYNGLDRAVYFSCDRSVSLSTEVKDYLLVASSLAVRGIPLNLSLQEDITLPLNGLGPSFSGSAVEFDGNEEAVFYNDRSKGLIYKSNLNGTGKCT